MSDTLNRVRHKLAELLSSRHYFAKVMRFEDYANQFQPLAYHLIESNRQTIVLNSQFVGDNTVLPQMCSLPDAYWMKLNQGKIIGGSDVVLSSNGYLLYDLLASADEYGANVTDGGLFLLFGKPHNIGNYYIYNYLRRPKGSIEKGISLSANMSGNYFHFMFQVASKFYFIENIDIEHDVPLLVDERVLKVPQMNAIIQMLNKSKRDIIPLKENVLYEVKELYCFSNPNIIIPNSKSKFQTDKQNNSFAYDKKALDFIRNNVLLPLEGECSTRTISKRIFLSRKKCGKRQINEDELLPILKEYGFEPVFPGDMDVESQASMFHQAEHIIGPSGAAFANLLFCKEDCKVLLFLSRRHNSTCYSSLGCVLGAQMAFMAGNTDYSGLHTPFFTIDPTTLENYLQSIYGSKY